MPLGFSMGGRNGAEFVSLGILIGLLGASDIRITEVSDEFEKVKGAAPLHQIQVRNQKQKRRSGDRRSRENMGRPREKTRDCPYEQPQDFFSSWARRSAAPAGSDIISSHFGSDAAS